MLFQVRWHWVCCALLTVAPAFGQAVSGSLLGTVTDNSDATVPGATVSILEVNTSVARTADTSESGNYVFPDLAPRIALLHGRMKSAEKEDVMARFQRGEVAILVSTSVVEVGIDIPNATVMMIEGADRFGLAQLHQFRGRIGRGPHESICLLLTDVDDPETMRRLTAVVTHRSGFDLAEIDLQNRGMGDLHGVQQHGNEFKMANLLDVALISDAQGEAVRLLDRDPTLAGEPALRRQLSAYRRVFALD